MQIFKSLAAATALVFFPFSQADASRGVEVAHFEALQELAFVGSSARGASLPTRGPAALSFDALGRRFELLLASNEHLLSSGVRENLAPGVALYKGTIAGNAESWVRIVMHDGVPRGLIWDGAELLAIEAPGDSSIATTEAVIFRLADTWVGSDAMTCGAAASPGSGAASFAALVEELEARAAGAVSQIELGAIGDYEFTSNAGGDAAAAAAMMARLNNVDGIFSAQLGVQIAVPEIETYTNSDDPFTDATAVSDLLDEVGIYRMNSPVQSSLGLTHLFTARDLDGSSVGLAYLSNLCSARFGAGLTQATNGLTTDSLVVAHELGHNFGAPHDGVPGSPCEAEPSTYIMATSVNGSDEFSQCSLDRMGFHMKWVSCIQPLPGVDVTVAASGAPPAPLLGNSATVNFDVSNTGTDPAPNVVVDVALPGIVSFVSAAAVPGSCTSGGGSVNCTIGTLAGGSGSTVTVSTIADAVGSGSFDAVVSADADDNVTNNTASVAVTVGLAVDLAISAPASAQLQLDRRMTVDISLANDSVVDASGVLLSVTADAGLQIGAVNWSLGTCDVAGQQINCQAGVFPGGDSASLTVDVTGIAAGRQDYSVSLTSTEADRNPADNNATGSVTVNTPGGGGNGGEEESGGASGVLFLSLLMWVWLRRRATTA